LAQAAGPLRPNLFDYQSVPEFIADMLAWQRKTDPMFSVSGRAPRVGGCSKALVTRVANGSRRLTRDRVAGSSQLLGLTHQEQQYLDRWVSAAGAPPRRTASKRGERREPRAEKPHRPRNHLLSDWLNPYVKDCLTLRGFRPEPQVIHRLLGGMASPRRIARSLEFLFREGFFRRKPDGDVVLDEQIEYTTDDVPDARIRQFHKRSLEIARRGIDAYSADQRRADAYVLALNDENLAKLKTLLAQCMDEIVRFRQDHVTDDQRLYQVVMHLTPLGGSSDAKGPE
jgi:uncharacterized protein (TIGR02147 family)